MGAASVTLIHTVLTSTCATAATAFLNFACNSAVKLACEYGMLTTRVIEANPAGTCGDVVWLLASSVAFPVLAELLFVLFEAFVASAWSADSTHHATWIHAGEEAECVCRKVRPALQSEQ